DHTVDPRGVVVVVGRPYEDRGGRGGAEAGRDRAKDAASSVLHQRDLERMGGMCAQRHERVVVIVVVHDQDAECAAHFHRKCAKHAVDVLAFVVHGHDDVELDRHTAIQVPSGGPMRSASSTRCTRTPSAIPGTAAGPPSAAATNREAMSATAATRASPSAESSSSATCVSCPVARPMTRKVKPRT